MWCDNCQQDVPGIASLVENEEIVCCARCGESLSTASSAENSAAEQEPALAAVGEVDSYDMPSWDDWELDEKLYDVDRLLSEVGVGPTRNISPEAAQWPPQSADALAEHPLVMAARKKAAEKKPRRQRRSSWVAWLVLSLSLMTFVCGSVLLGWSFFSEKVLLWRVGLPLSLVGQAGLLIGLILQLEGLWQNDNEATETLDDLDEQIHELRQAAAMLNATHSRAGQSFYLHMAEGASPHLMLADLKSQLDLLAVQLEKGRR
jgi:hypothetical protein